MLAQTKGVNGILPSASDFLNKCWLLSTLIFYPKRIMESLPKTSELSTRVSIKTERDDGPWTFLELLIR